MDVLYKTKLWNEYMLGGITRNCTWDTYQPKLIDVYHDVRADLEAYKGCCEADVLSAAAKLADVTIESGMAGEKTNIMQNLLDIGTRADISYLRHDAEGREMYLVVQYAGSKRLYDVTGETLSSCLQDLADKLLLDIDSDYVQLGESYPELEMLREHVRWLVSVIEKTEKKEEEK